MFYLTRQPSREKITTPEKRVPALQLACCEMFQKLEQQQNKNVSGCSTYQEQVRDRGVPQSYPDEWLELRWIRPGQTSLIPLQCRRREKRKRRGFTSIQMLHTHTPTHTPGRDRVNPERQEEEKSGHKRRAKAGTAQGGRGTNGPPEPTYTAKRT